MGGEAESDKCSAPVPTKWILIGHSLGTMAIEKVLTLSGRATQSCGVHLYARGTGHVFLPGTLQTISCCLQIFTNSEDGSSRGMSSTHASDIGTRTLPELRYCRNPDAGGEMLFANFEEQNEGFVDSIPSYVVIFIVYLVGMRDGIFVFAHWASIQNHLLRQILHFPPLLQYNDAVNVHVRCACRPQFYPDNPDKIDGVVYMGSGNRIGEAMAGLDVPALLFRGTRDPFCPADVRRKIPCGLHSRALWS